MNLTLFNTSRLGFGPIEYSTVEGKTHHWRSLYIIDGGTTHRIDFHGNPLNLTVETLSNDGFTFTPPEPF